MIRHLRLWCQLIALSSLIGGCYEYGPPDSSDHPVTSVRTGASVLVESGFEPLLDLRVGLIANQTTVVDSTSLIDILANQPSVHLDALFGPEHGLRGDAQAGEDVADGFDEKTGVKVFSLFGTRSAPDSTVLRNLDILVFDIQDVGARFYTYISTMGLAMQAAARSGIPFMVLDRPNPLGGTRVDGYILEPEHRSGVGLYEIPVQHGMTVAELAQMIQAEQMLPGLEDLDLRIVRMEGWRRDMLWPDTGLDWIPTSPNIPTFETALVYAGTCFFEGTIISEGRGTETPFLKLGAPWLNATSWTADLTHEQLPGVEFTETSLEPISRPGKSLHPRFEDQQFRGLEIRAADIRAFRPVQTGIYALVSAYRLTPDSVRSRVFDDRWLGSLAGTDRLARDILRGDDARTIVASWESEVSAFMNRKSPYLLYD